MKNSSRLVRVFISSTFRDFLGERDELVKKVFPELRLRCRSRHVELLEVDLRWGITEEQSRRGETLGICLQEIDRCRPSSPVFFIGLLGERYGWIPEADFFPRDVLEDPHSEWIHEHIGGRSVTELEILHGVLRNPQMFDRAFFYFREDGYEKRHWPSIHAIYPDLQPEAFNNASEADPAAADAKQRDLKRRIRGSGLRHSPRTYETPEDAGAMVLEDLWAQIDAAYPAAEVPDESERQRMEHAVFAQSRTKGYVSRPELFETLDLVFEQDSPAVKVVTGSSGGGKSALIAAWMEQSAERLPERCFVHYIGGTPESGTAHGLVRRLMQTIRRWGVVDKAVPDDFSEAVGLLPKWLESAAVGKSGGVLLVLDALNQIEDAADRSLWWLPSVLPPGVRLIASTLPGPAEETLRKRGWMCPENVVEVTPLSIAERREIIARYLSRFAKQIEEPVVRRLSEAPQTSNALFLKVVLDELRSRASHEALSSMVERMLEARDPVELFTQVFKGLEEFDRDRPNLVRETLGYLHEARRGLTESELLQLLSDHPDPATNPLPHRIWAPVYLALEESLVNRNGRLGFFHDYLREAVEREYLDEESERIRIHARFGEVALAWQTQRFSPSLRTYGLAFGAYHLRKEGDHEKLWSLLQKDAYRAAQKAEFNRVDEAVEALREGVERYAQRNGATGEDDTRLCWLTLRCGAVAREARTQLGEVFEAFRTGHSESMERVDTALERLSILEDRRFVDACLLLLYLECERPEGKTSAGFEARCDRVVKKLAARAAALPSPAQCPRWIARALLGNFPTTKAHHFFTEQVSIAAEGARLSGTRTPQREMFWVTLCETALLRGDLSECLGAIRQMQKTDNKRDALLEVAQRWSTQDKPAALDSAREAIRYTTKSEAAEVTAEVVRKLATAGFRGLARKVLAAGIMGARNKDQEGCTRDLSVFARELATCGFQRICSRLAGVAYSKAKKLAAEHREEGVRGKVLAMILAEAAARRLAKQEGRDMSTRMSLDFLKKCEWARFSHDDNGDRILFKEPFTRWLEVASAAAKMGEIESAIFLLEQLDSVASPDLNAEELGEIAVRFAELGMQAKAVSVLERIRYGRLVGETKWDDQCTHGEGHDYRSVAAVRVVLRLYQSGDAVSADSLVKAEDLRRSGHWFEVLREMTQWHANRGDMNRAIAAFTDCIGHYPERDNGVNSCLQSVLLWSMGQRRESVKRVYRSFSDGSICEKTGEAKALEWIEDRAMHSGNIELLCRVEPLSQKPDANACLLAVEHLLEEGDFFAAVKRLQRTRSLPKSVQNFGKAAIYAHRDLMPDDPDEPGLFLYELENDELAELGDGNLGNLEAQHRAIRLAKRGRIDSALQSLRTELQGRDLADCTVAVARHLSLQGRFGAAIRLVEGSPHAKTRFCALLEISRTAGSFGKSRKAGQMLEKALSIAPAGTFSGGNGMLKIARLYSQAGLRKAAVRILERAVRGEGFKPERLRRGAEAKWASEFLCEMRRYDAAARWAALLPDCCVRVPQEIRIGTAALNAGRRKLAHRMAQKAAMEAKAIRDMDVLLNLSDFLVRLGFLEDAAAICAKILRLGKTDFARLGCSPGEAEVETVERLACVAAVLHRSGRLEHASEVTSQLCQWVKTVSREQEADEALYQMVCVLASISSAGDTPLAQELEKKVRNRINSLQSKDNYFEELTHVLDALFGSDCEHLRQMAGIRAVELLGKDFDFEAEWEWRDFCADRLCTLAPKGPILAALHFLRSEKPFEILTGSGLLRRLLEQVERETGLVQSDRSKFDQTQEWIRALQTVNPASLDWGKTLCLLLTASYALSGNLQQTRSMTVGLPKMGVDLAGLFFIPRRCKISNGERFTVQTSEATCLVFQFCPEGEFWMDGFPGQLGGQRDTDPSRVRITRPFWIAEEPVSVAFWDECYPGAWQNRSSSELEKCRLTTWEQAEEFAQRMTQRFAPKGWRFAVPTEAQWEYATKQEGLSMKGTHSEWCCDLFYPSLPAGDDPGITLDQKWLSKIGEDSETLTKKVIRHWGASLAENDPPHGTARSAALDRRPQALRLVLIRKPVGQEARREYEISQARFAKHLAQAGKSDSAASIFRRLLKSKVRQFGDRHPVTLELMRALGNCLSSRGSTIFFDDGLRKLF
ncbi:MAG: hypothetical protein RIS92_1760, partial [Verrucomicrobiota bacterium]